MHLDARWRKRLGEPWVIFWAALLVRLLYVTVAHLYRIKTHDEFGWEMGYIARSLVEGRGYSSPFGPASGPTAWTAPLYPLMIAAVLKIFGEYTRASAWVLLSMNGLFSALTTLPTFHIARRCLNRRLAVWSAWVWALYTPFMHFAIRWIWEMALTGLLFACVFLLAMKMRRTGERDAGLIEPSLGQWLVFAVTWGVIAMLNPSLLIVLPAMGIWILCGVNEVWVQVGKAFVAGVVFVACLAPWSVRNYEVFGKFVPLRGDFGAEMYYANGPGANGLVMDWRHPFHSPNEEQMYARMGEVEYSRYRGEIAKEEIKADPGHFLADCARRAYFFWFGLPHEKDYALNKRISDWARVVEDGFASLCGIFGLVLALRRRVVGAWLFLWAFVLVPLVPYVVYVHARFYYPLEPLTVVLGVWLFASAEWGKKRTA
jgi:hypothetical protein